MIRKGLLLVLSGPSGVGKGTLRKIILDEFKDMTYCVSATTRPKRPGEREGIDYIFLTPEEFQRKIGDGEFVEWANVYGNYYGTPREPMISLLRSGIDVIVEKDVQGANALMKLFPEGVYVFVAPPNLEELRSRITGRGTDQPGDIETRLDTARHELRQMARYDYLVVNDDLDEAARKLEAIIVAERCKPDRVQVDLGGI